MKQQTEPKFIITFTNEVPEKEFYRHLKKLMGKRYFEKSFLKIEEDLLNGYAIEVQGYRFKIENHDAKLDHPGHPGSTKRPG